MSPELLAVLAFALVAAIAGLAGVWLMYRHEAAARRHTPELITFASGLLITGSLLHLLDRSGELAGSRAALAAALVAFTLLYVAENHFVPHPHSRSEHDHGAAHSEGSALAALLGLALHGVLDGAAAGAGFSVGLLTGGVIVSLVISHKLPVGIASMSVLYKAGYSRARAFRYSVWVALITPVAILLAYFAFRGASDHLLGILLGGAGGTFLYVGAADLLPEGQAAGSRRNTLAFLAGAAVMIVALLVAPGAHG